MTNEEILKTVESGLELLRVDMARGIGEIICKIKDDDFKKKIEDTLKYMDCEAYTNSCRTGFRLFAEHLLKTLNER